MSRNPEETRARLLAAARVEFAAHGLAGARVDRIAKAAGVNKERIYAYFGSKEKLYDVVARLALERIRVVTPMSIHEGETVGDFVRRVFEVHRQDPTFIRILMWEALEMGGRDLIADTERSEFYRGRIEDMAQQLGLADFADAQRLFFTLVGLAAWPVAMPNLAHLMSDGALDTEAGMDGLREFLYAMAVGGAKGAVGTAGSDGADGAAGE